MDSLKFLIFELHTTTFVNIYTTNRKLKSQNHTHLNKTPLAESPLHQRLCNPSSSVGSRAIHLRVVLARESTASMSSPTTIRVNNDLPACETCITLRSSNDEVSTRVDVVFGVFIKVLFWDDRLDSLLHNVSSQLVQGYLLRVLGRDNHCVHTQGNGSTLAVMQGFILICFHGKLQALLKFT